MRRRPVSKLQKLESRNPGLRQKVEAMFDEGWPVRDVKYMIQAQYGEHLSLRSVERYKSKYWRSRREAAEQTSNAIGPTARRHQARWASDVILSPGAFSRGGGAVLEFQASLQSGRVRELRGSRVVPGRRPCTTGPRHSATPWQGETKPLGGHGRNRKTLRSRDALIVASGDRERSRISWQNVAY